MSFSLKKNKQIFLIMIMVVPLAGELNFFPFNNTFRVSFGSPTFFFFLLMLRRIPAIISGFAVGIVVVGFRILLDLVSLDFTYSFQAHYPTFFYYFTFACCFYLAQVTRYYRQSLVIGVLGIIFEILASAAELTFQYIAFNSTVTYKDLHKVSVIAIFRSFFTVGFFNLLRLYKTRLREEQTRKQNAHLVMIISNLYEESIHLNKTLKNSESITKKSYNLYHSLTEFEYKKEPLPIEQLCQKALEIAGETHEIKKDNQRIYSGLSKLISHESYSEYMNIYKLMNITVQAHKNYAHLLQKNIKFLLDIKGEHPDYHVYKVLSIVNNLITNAAEVIKEKGTVTICVAKQHDVVEFQIGDNGPGISQKRKHLIFKPGFTSKYDKNGTPSTGIGLTYVKELVEGLEGEITLQSKPEINGSVFTIRLPIHNLVRKG